MSFWTAIAILGVVGVIGEVIKSGHRSRSVDSATRKLIDEFDQRIARMEERLANLETLVLDSEKNRRFDDLSK